METELYQQITPKDIAKALNVFDSQAITELNKLIKEINLKLIEVN